MPDYVLDVNKTAPAIDAVAVTTADGADLATVPTRAVYVGGAGDLKVDMASGATVTWKAVPVGTLLPIQVRRIYATGTTATNILALY